MLAAYLIVVLAPVGGLFAYCIAQVFISRTFRRRGPYFSMLWGGLLGLTAMTATACAGISRMNISTEDCIALFALNLATYLALAWGYFHFVNLNIASLRIRMLQVLLQAGGELRQTTCSRSTTLRRWLNCDSPGWSKEGICWNGTAASTAAGSGS